MSKSRKEATDTGKEREERQGRGSSTVRITRLSMLSALSALGTFIPFPSPVGTIGFDSLPGFMASFLFEPIDGAIVLIVGHAISVFAHGPQLGILHIPIALGMGVTGWLTGMVRRRSSLIPAAAVAILANTLLFPLAAPVIGWGGSLALIPYLLAASSVNVVTAAICSKAAEAAVELARREQEVKDSKANAPSGEPDKEEG